MFDVISTLGAVGFTLGSPDGITAAIRPLADVLDGEQVVLRTNDGSYTAVTEQVRPAGGDQTVQRSFTSALFSTLRILFSVAHRPSPG